MQNGSCNFRILELWLMRNVAAGLGASAGLSWGGRVQKGLWRRVAPKSLTLNKNIIRNHHAK